LKASPASKKQRPHRQNEFSEHQNASNADALTGAGGFCKKLALPTHFDFHQLRTDSFERARLQSCRKWLIRNDGL